MDPAETKAIEWPKCKLLGVEYTLRYSYSAQQQLYAWGLTGSPHVPDPAWAAAMAGSYMPDGTTWRSAGFRNWLEVADSITDAERAPMVEAVAKALKKAFPGLTATVEPDPGDQPPKDQTSA